MLASVNYQQWNASRTFAEQLPLSAHRVWANAEWGLRYYLEARGALPMHEHQWVGTGDLVVTSDLGYPVEFNHGGRSLVHVADANVQSTVPLRLIGLGSHAGYDTAAQGFLPFAVGTGAIDRLHAEKLVEKQPSRAWLDMNAPDFDNHAVAGTYRLEENRFRWTSGTAAFQLKVPAHPATVAADVFIPRWRQRGTWNLSSTAGRSRRKTAGREPPAPLRITPFLETKAPRGPSS